MKESSLCSNLKELTLDLSFNLMCSEFCPVVLCVSDHNSYFSQILAEYILASTNFVGFCYGRAKNPITTKNLEKAISFIKEKHSKSKIIVVMSGESYIDEKLFYGNGNVKINNLVFGDYCIYPIFSKMDKVRQIKNIKTQNLALSISKCIINATMIAGAVKNSVTKNLISFIV